VISAVLDLQAKPAARSLFQLSTLLWKPGTGWSVLPGVIRDVIRRCLRHPRAESRDRLSCPFLLRWAKSSAMFRYRLCAPEGCPVAWYQICIIPFHLPHFVIRCIHNKCIVMFCLSRGCLLGCIRGACLSNLVGANTFRVAKLELRNERTSFNWT
jgi:hypothetical protein